MDAGTRGVVRGGVCLCVKTFNKMHVFLHNIFANKTHFEAP
jgi:hypothetical protein